PAPAVTATPPVEAVPAPVRVAPKKKPLMLIAAIGALVVLGGVGALLMSGGGDSVNEQASVAERAQAEQLMREEEQARMLAEELKNPRSFRNDRYSFEVSERGLLRKLVGVGNRTIIDEFGWLE